MVRGLFESRVGGARPADRDVLLAGAAALAGPVLGTALRGGAPALDGGAFGVVHGLYWLTVNLTDRAPLLLAIDDAHWADQASMRFAVHLLRRVEALPVLLVVAARSDEPYVDDTALEVLRGDPLTTTLHPTALTEPAAAAVVRAALPLADAGLCRACHAATGGNPLLLRMLSRALRDDGIDPTINAGQRIAELAPQVVAATLRPRLRRLPKDVTRFAGAGGRAGRSRPAATRRRAGRARDRPGHPGHRHARHGRHPGPRPTHRVHTPHRPSRHLRRAADR